MGYATIIKNMKIKVNDNVKVLSGKDRAKTGKVTQVFAQNGKIVVDGINKIKKHFFHFKPEFKSVIDELLSNPTFDSPYKKHEQFFRSAHVVFFTVNMLAEQVVRIMDLFCDSDLLQSIRAYNKSSLRLLSYDPYCEVQAAQHTDKSLFTFQLWADVRGLVLYDYNREPIYHEHIPGKLMMFLGRKMEKKFEDVRNDERPLAIPHEVCVSDEDKSKQRNSAVFFVHDQTDIVNFQPSLLKVVKPV
jgi:hypothetical protein